MYEVLKFIEHGAQCRQSMDCEKGDLLIYYLRENRQMEKETLFEWFRQIGISADQFHRCRGGRRYRYLNPCSIVVAEDGRVYLLDLEAPENESVMKKMQQRAIRKHFVKTASGEENGLAGDPDLFGYGRTMQFVLAYTAVVPQLTRREEKKLERIIERCTEFTRNRTGASNIFLPPGFIFVSWKDPVSGYYHGKMPSKIFTACGSDSAYDFWSLPEDIRQKFRWKNLTDNFCLWKNPLIIQHIVRVFFND